MKRTQLSQIILLLVLSFVFVSCTTNKFSVRKNFQPRVSIEAVTPQPTETSPTTVAANVSADTLSEKNQMPTEKSVKSVVKPKESILEKIVRKTFPKKKEILDQVFDSPKKHLNKTKDTNLEGTQIPGLIIGILSLTFAIASLCMIAVMVNGGLIAGFVTGLILALIAMVLGIIGKFFPFRGMSTTGVVLAGLAIFLLCIFLALILAGLI